jgi:uncharacterized protein (DUF2236 family)
MRGLPTGFHLGVRTGAAGPASLRWSLSLGKTAAALLRPIDPAAAVDLTRPRGEPALLPPDSIAWRVFGNPLTLFVGGVAAVVLQLAEPRIQGAWGDTRFRADPIGRLRRTAHAAMVTVYGPQSAAEAMIAAVCRRHATVRGVTAAGKSYSASDPELLNWVQATVSFGMAEAHQRFIGPLSPEERDRFHAEGAVIGRLYGATSAPRTAAEGEALFRTMHGLLAANDAIPALLDALRRAPILPPPFGFLQGLMVRGAVDLIPPELRHRLALDRSGGLPRSGAVVLRQLGRRAGRVAVATSPAVEACRRLGLPPDHLRRTSGRL